MALGSILNINAAESVGPDRQEIAKWRHDHQATFNLGNITHRGVKRIKIVVVR
jgi:hypothetical protein